MKKKILYIGNKLAIHGYTSTSIDTLGVFLEDDGYQVIYSSSKKNKFLRLFDMIYTTISNCKKIDYVLIDVYSTKNFWYAIIISQLCRVLKLKYITKLHGGNLPYRLSNNPYLCDLIFKNAYKNSAPSKYLMFFFSKRYYSNLIYIPNTFNIKKYHFDDRQIVIPHLFWVRSLAKIYNPEMLIKVFYETKKLFPQCYINNCWSR